MTYLLTYLLINLRTYVRAAYLKLQKTKLIISLCRLDADQCVRRNVQDLLHIKDPDYYEFEGNNTLWLSHSQKK